MTQSTRTRKTAAVLAMAALAGLTSWTGPAGATSQAGVSVVPDSTVKAIVTEEPIRINMHRGTEVTTRRIRVEVGGHTSWHYHPGPHLVTVARGRVTVYETDCTPRGTYEAGTGFFDPGSAKPRHIHALYNAVDDEADGDGEAEVVITDFREQGGKLAVDADPQPTTTCQ